MIRRVVTGFSTMQRNASGLHAIPGEPAEGVGDEVIDGGAMHRDSGRKERPPDESENTGDASTSMSLSRPKGNGELAGCGTAHILAPIRGVRMSQVTIYIDEDTEARTRAAARAAGVSLSRWITSVLRSRVGSAWPADVAALEGSWRLQDDGPERDSVEGGDLPREPL